MYAFMIDVYETRREADGVRAPRAE
jgi:hypothetical protein